MNRDWVKKKNSELRRKLYEQETVTKGFHSWSYHSFFEDYSEIYQIGRDGKTRLVRNYEGAYYWQNLSREAYIGLRIVYAAVFAVLTALFAATGLMARASDTVWFTVLPEVATVLALSALAYTLFVNYLFIPTKMTIGDYRSSSGALKFISFVLTVCFALDSLLTLLYLPVSAGSFKENDAAAVLLFAGCAGLSFAVNKIEKRISYGNSDEKKS